jgi:hypothetical protein
MMNASKGLYRNESTRKGQHCTEKRDGGEKGGGKEALS